MINDYFAFSATEVGYNHTKISKVCEDASDFYDDEKMHICVVADGHGSDNYPRTEYGSKYAVNAAIESVIDFVNTADPKDVLKDNNNNYCMLNQLAKSILKAWYQSVEEDFNKRPFSEEELSLVSEKYKRKYISDNEEERHIEKAYGCTLILFAVTDEYSFGLQIGDGKCVYIDPDGKFSEPIPWDENCQLNVTTSICDSDAIDEFRYFVTENPQTAVFIGSDGIDDSYASDEELYALYRSILKIFIENGVDIGKSEIKEYLPVLTKKGSGDDVSVALIMDLQRATEIKPSFELQNEIFKLTEELKDKKSKKQSAIGKQISLRQKVRKWQQTGENIDESIQKCLQELNELKDIDSKLDEEIYSRQVRLDNLIENLNNLVYEEEVQNNNENSAENSNDADPLNQQIHEIVEDKTKEEVEEPAIIDEKTDTTSE